MSDNGQLSDEQLLRYNRQILLNDFDVEGQERLLRAAVLVVGLGGLGCPAALYLAAAGVGTLLLADGDAVELGNLQRQIAHGDADIGHNKAASAAESIAKLNPGVAVEVIPRQLTEADMPGLVGRADLVVDATDNYTARFALNRACIAAGVPMRGRSACSTRCAVDPATAVFTRIQTTIRPCAAVKAGCWLRWWVCWVRCRRWRP